MKFLESSTFSLDYLDLKINSLLFPNTSMSYLDEYDTMSRNEVLVIELRASYALFT